MFINRWMGRHTGMLQILQEKDSWDAAQHGWTLWTWCWVKQASHKRDKHCEFPHGCNMEQSISLTQKVQEGLPGTGRAVEDWCLVDIRFCFDEMKTALGNKSGLCASHWRASQGLSSFRSPQGPGLPKQIHRLSNFLSTQPASFAP